MQRHPRALHAQRTKRSSITPRFHSVTWDRIEAAITHTQRRIVGGHIPGNAPSQKLKRARSDTCEPVKFELEEDSRRRLLRRCRESLPNHTQHPAIAIVLEACDRLQRLLVGERIVPAPQERQMLRDRPLTGKVDLLDLLEANAGFKKFSRVTPDRIESASGRGCVA